MDNQCQHLPTTQRNELTQFLQKLEEFFDGTHGTWKTDLVSSRIKENEKPIFSRPYPVQKVHKGMFKDEVECLVLLGVFEVANDSEWGALSFAQLNLNQTEYIS